jgi:hypothetical protein
MSGGVRGGAGDDPAYSIADVRQVFIQFSGSSVKEEVIEAAIYTIDTIQMTGGYTLKAKVDDNIC